MRNVHEYFCATALIWQDYFAGLISMRKRDDLLAALRVVLPSLPLSHE